MAIYVDTARNPYSRMIMSHMTADTVHELNAMADHLGIQRRWFQNHGCIPHYDVCQAKKRIAIKAGAIEISIRELIVIGKRMMDEYSYR